MARRTFEMSFQIGGRLASSFSSSFSNASSQLANLNNESRQTQRALNQLSRQYRTGRITQEQFEQSARELNQQLEVLNRQIQRTNLLQSSLNSVGNTLRNGFNTAKNVAGIVALGTAAAATGLAMKSLNEAASFQQQITKVGVLADATASDMKKLNNTALELGASTSLSASEVAVAMGELAAKGMDTNKIIAAMPGILAAAEASGEDLALTSEVVTSALNAFGLEASMAGHIADVMAMSANATAAGVEDLGYSFKYAAPVAKTLGISLEELAAATGIMVDKGLSGEQAGTSLRMALIRLSNPPAAASKALKKLGISVTDSENKFKSITELSSDWNKATEKLTDTQKVQYAATVFGTEAATGMLNLFSSGSGKMDEFTKSLEKSTGSAQKAAKSMKDNYAGALEELSGAFESAQIKFMTPVLPVFQGLFEGLGGMIDENMDGIEQAGERLATSLRSVFEPFSIKKPELQEGFLDPEYLDYYKEQLNKYNLFSEMNFGDKFTYMLDEAAEKAEQWLSGSGGESMNQIFGKLGEIAANAWWNAFTGAVKSSASNLAEGNIASGVGMGAAAWLLGGGLVVKGAIGAGKLAKGLIGTRTRGATNATTTTSANNGTTRTTTPVATQTATAPTVTNATPTATQTTPNTANSTRAATTATTNVPNATTTQASPTSTTGTRAVSTAAQTTSNTTGRLASGINTARNLGSKALKVVGKAALPVAAVSTVVDVVASDDKPKAAVEGLSGLAAGAGGAKIGAAIGTAIAPGIGTAIGGALGGIAGFIGGRFLGGKSVDVVRDTSTSTDKESAKLDTSKSSLNLDTFNQNLASLNEVSEQAVGWLESLNNIEVAGKKVENALNNLANRIDNISLPSMAKGRVSYLE